MKAFSLSVVSPMVFLVFAGVSTAQTTDNSAATQSPPSVQATSSPEMPDVIGARPDSQSYPAKYSKRNAQLDKLPTMGHPIPLTDVQKRRIVEAVTQQNKPIETIAASPAELLSDRVSVQTFPDGLAAEIPMLDHLSYVRIPNKILLVMPSNKIVVGEVATE